MLINPKIFGSITKALTSCCLATVLLWAISLPVYLSSSENSQQTILFLGNEKIAPIIYQENGIAKGIVVDIAKALGTKIGLNVEVEATDWNIAQERVSSGEADALLQINPNPEREKIYDFSTELLKSEFSIFRDTTDISINNIHDLIGKKVGAESGGYPYYLLSRQEGIDIVIIPDWVSGFEMIQNKELDALVVDKWIGQYELAKSRLRGIHIVEEPIETTYSRIAVKKGNTELLSLINAGLEEMNNDGTMAQILNHWKSTSVVYFTEESLRKIILYTVIGALLVVVFGVLLVLTRLRKMNRQLELKVQERTQELNQANEQLQKMSMIDGLTNISNRRCFDDLFKKAWRISLREKQPLSVIMLDIDKFKEYNDMYGHLAGDQCLKSIAGILEQAVKRPADLVARFGGEEFIVLLYNTTEEGAQIVAEDIRDKISSSVITNDGIDTAVTASMGVAAIIPCENADPVELIELADKAMYQAKKEGRNKVIKASSLFDNS